MPSKHGYDDDPGYLNLSPLKASLEELLPPGQQQKTRSTTSLLSSTDVSMHDVFIDDLTDNDDEDSASPSQSRAFFGSDIASQRNDDFEDISKTPEPENQVSILEPDDLHGDLNNDSSRLGSYVGSLGPPSGPPSGPLSGDQNLYFAHSAEHPATTLARAFAFNNYVNIAYRLVILLLLCVAVYLLGSIFAKDVINRVLINKENLLVDIASCQKQYFDNLCLPHLRSPKLEDKCNSWDKCMSQDPDRSVSYLASTAEAVVEVIGVFLSPLKNLGVMSMASLFLCTFLTVALMVKIFN